jgi:hypothetical protein
MAQTVRQWPGLVLAASAMLRRTCNEQMTLSNKVQNEQSKNVPSGSLPLEPTRDKPVFANKSVHVLADSYQQINKEAPSSQPYFTLALIPARFTPGCWCVKISHTPHQVESV